MRARIALLAVLVGVPAALAQTAGAAPPPKTFSVVSVSVGNPVETDKPPKGPSKGDTIVFKDKLVNAKAQFGKKKGAVVGSDRGTMTFHTAHTASFDGVAVLPGGTVTLKGPVSGVGGQPDAMIIPVAGGTGKYSGATGYVFVGPGKTRSTNTYFLKYPTGPVA